MFKRISFQIMASILGASIFTAALVGGFSLYEGRRYIRAEAEEKLIQSTLVLANRFSHTIERTESAVSAIHSFIMSTVDAERFSFDPVYRQDYDSLVDGYLSELSSNFSDAIGFYVTFNPAITDTPHEIWYADFTGDNTFQRVDNELYQQYMIVDEDWIYPEASLFDPDQEGMEYLYEPMKRRIPMWFDPYVELGLDLTAISYVRPLFEGDTNLGVAGMDIDIERIKKEIEGLQIYNKGYAFLLNQDRQVVIHPDYHEPVPLEKLHLFNPLLFEQQLEISPSGILTSLNGKSLVSYAELTNHWIIVLVPPYREIMAPLFDMNMMIIALTILGIFLSVVTAYLLSSRFSGSMDAAAKELRYLELGDFTHEIPTDLLSRNDDLGHFIKSVHTMQGIIKDLLIQVNDSGTGARDPGNVKRTFRESKRAVSNAAIAIEQIALDSELKETNLKQSIEELARVNENLQQRIDVEVAKSRKQDAAIVYQSRQAMMGEMLGNIIHQWRQPLGNLNLLLANIGEAHRFDELSEETLFTYLEKAERIIMNLSDTTVLFQNFLNSKREKNWFSLVDAIKFAIELMDEILCSSHITVRWSRFEDRALWGYENELVQVIINVLSNAGEALLEVPSGDRRIDIMVDSTANGFVEIGLKNSGPMIPENVSEKIFGFQFTTKGAQHGSGLGLYMSRIIVEEHFGGVIEFENQNDGVLWRIKLDDKGGEA